MDKTETSSGSTPLDRLLTEAKFTNHDVVEAAKGQLSHKNVQKARTGRRQITRKIAFQIVEAINKLLLPEEPYRLEHLLPAYATKRPRAVFIPKA